MIADVSTEDDSILIFTSPSSVKCFLKHHTFTTKHSLIVIGTTTAKSIPNDFSYAVSPEPNIASCMRLAKESFGD